MSSAFFQHRLQFCYGQEKQLVYVPAFSKTNKVSIGFKSCPPRKDAYVGGFTKIFWFISQTWTKFLLKSSTLGGTTSSLTRPQNNNWKWKNNYAVRAARTLANFPTVLSRITWKQCESTREIVYFLFSIPCWYYHIIICKYCKGERERLMQKQMVHDVRIFILM